MDGLEKEKAMSEKTIVPLDGFSDLEMEPISLALGERQKVLTTTSEKDALSEEDAFKERRIDLSDLVIAKLYLSAIEASPIISTLYYKSIGSIGFWK